MVALLCFKSCSLGQLISFHATYIYWFFHFYNTWHLDLIEHGCIPVVNKCVLSYT